MLNRGWRETTPAGHRLTQEPRPQRGRTTSQSPFDPFEVGTDGLSYRRCHYVPPAVKHGGTVSPSSDSHLAICLSLNKDLFGFPRCYINANQGTYISFVYIAEGFYAPGFEKSGYNSRIIIADLHHTAVHLGLAIHVLYSGCCLQNRCYNLVLRMLRVRYHTSNP